MQSVWRSVASRIGRRAAAEFEAGGAQRIAGARAALRRHLPFCRRAKAYPWAQPPRGSPAPRKPSCDVKRQVQLLHLEEHAAVVDVNRVAAAAEVAAGRGGAARGRGSRGRGKGIASAGAATAGAGDFTPMEAAAVG
jgi:hypothetical protein